MVRRGGRGPPYSAVVALVTWAAANWHTLDGYAVEQWGPGVDLFDLPLHRFVNFLHWRLVSNVWDDDQRAEIEQALEWPDTAAERDLERSDRQAREALQSLGISLPDDWQPPGAGAVSP